MTSVLTKCLNWFQLKSYGLKLTSMLNKSRRKSGEGGTINTEISMKIEKYIKYALPKERNASDVEYKCWV